MLWMSSRELVLAWLGSWAIGSLHEAHESGVVAVAPALRMELPTPGLAPTLPHRGFGRCFRWQPYLPLNDEPPGLAAFVTPPSSAIPIVGPSSAAMPTARDMSRVTDRMLFVRTASFVSGWQLPAPPSEALQNGEGCCCCCFVIASMDFRLLAMASALSRTVRSTFSRRCFTSLWLSSTACDRLLSFSSVVNSLSGACHGSERTKQGPPREWVKAPAQRQRGVVILLCDDKAQVGSTREPGPRAFAPS